MLNLTKEEIEYLIDSIHSSICDNVNITLGKEILKKLTLNNEL